MKNPRVFLNLYFILFSCVSLVFTNDIFAAAGGGGSSSGSTSSSSPNTGNNPGNPNAEGYQGGSSSSGSTSSTTNTGNNPGNPNAEGYHSGGSSSSGNSSGGSSGGGSSGGSSTGSGSSGGSTTNTGNNPGNPNAAGYNGGTSTSTSTSTSSSSSSSTSSAQGSVVGLMSAGISAVSSAAKSAGEAVMEMAGYVGEAMGISPQAAVEVVDRAVATIENNWETEVAANKAGLDAQAKNTYGTLGAGSTGYSIAQERAYYRGRAAFYEENNITARIGAISPIEEAYGIYTVQQDPRLTAISEAYLEGSVMIANLDSGTTIDQLRDIIGPEVYDNLSDYQRSGLQNSVVVAGAPSPEIMTSSNGMPVDGFYNTTGYLVFSVNEIDFIKTDLAAALADPTITTEEEKFFGLIAHESLHAADDYTYEKAIEVLNNPYSTQVEKDLATSAVEALETRVDLYYYSDISDVNYSVYAEIPSLAKPALTQSLDYLGLVAELAAYGTTPRGRMSWAEQFSNTTGLSIADSLETFDTYHELASENQEEVEAFAESLPGYGR